MNVRQKPLKDKGLFWLTLPRDAVHQLKAWWQELETGCHFTSAIGAERRMPVLSLLAPFYSGCGLSPWVDATCTQGPSSSGRPLWKHPYSHVQKFVSMVIFHLRLAQ